MIKVYRVKDTATGKYFSSGRMSYSPHSFTNRGRIFHRLSDLKNSFALKKTDIYRTVHYQLFPCYHNKIPYYAADNKPSLDFRYQSQIERELIQKVTVWFPNTWVVVDETDTVIDTLNEVMK